MDVGTLLAKEPRLRPILKAAMNCEFTWEPDPQYPPGVGIRRTPVDYEKQRLRFWAEPFLGPRRTVHDTLLSSQEAMDLFMKTIDAIFDGEWIEI